MVTKPGARPMRFDAVERLAVDRVAFSWEARFPVAPLISIKVSDSYADGEGSLRVRILGFPLQRRSGYEIALGEAYRYLAELPWVPHALAANRQLEWQALDERSVEVSTRLGSERPAARLDFDASGDVIRSSAESRPREVGGAWIRTAWGGGFHDYAILGGIRMPTRGEVYWQLPEARFVYWRGKITSARASNAAFELH